MNERFKQCLKVVLQNEGGLVDRKEDRGGRTNFGITQRVYDDFNRHRGQPERDVKFIHESEVETIYYTSYWLPASCDKIPEPLDLLVFDFAVNSGVGRASKTLQSCLGVASDGKIGDKTIQAITDAVNNSAFNALCLQYLTEREAFYDRVVAKDPTQQVFIKGWKNRLDKLAKHLHD